jgi:ABC-type lipoprotein release transport system permease subunit
MGSLGAILTIVAQRSMGNRRLLLTIIVGVIFAAALAASVAIYSDAIRDLGLSYALRSQPITALDIQITSSSHTARAREYALRRDLTTRLLDRHVRPIIRDTVRIGQSATFFLTAPGAAVIDEDPNRPRANFQFFEKLGDHVRLVDGRPPRPVPRPYDPRQRPEIEVLAGKAAADRLGIRVGDIYDLHPFWRREVPPVRVTVAGIIEPLNPDEEYWLGRTDRFDLTRTSWPTYLFFTDEPTLVEVVAAYLPDMDASYQTYAFVAPDRINSRNAAQVQANLQAMTAAFRQDIERTTVETKLTETIASFRQKLFFTRLPLFALMLQVIGIVLYYLVMVSTMLVERQAGEIALLKSRGASTWQIMVVYAIEGGALALAGILLGPLLAAGVITLLGPTPPFRALSEGRLLDIHLSAQAFGLAAFGAGLALLALLWPAYRATRYSIVHYKQGMGRPPQQPIFLRYYLDLFLIVVAAFLFYELRRRSSLVTERLFGDLSTDPLLLVSPALFMLMIALIFLRLFPVALRLVTWATAGMSGTAIPLGLRRMVRAPLHFSRLILLLILASAVGVFAASFRATLDRSYEDRIAYQAGSALRFEDIRRPAQLDATRLAQTTTEAAGAAFGTPVWRVGGSYSLGQFRTTDFTMLGVRPDEFARVAFWRDDFAGRSLADLLAPLRRNPPPPAAGPALPEGARRFGVWVWTAMPFTAFQLGARVIDDSGSTWEYRLFGPDQDRYRPGEWQFWQADLTAPGFGRRPEPGGPRPGGRVWLQSLFVRLQGAPQAAERTNVWLDDVEATTAADLPPEYWRTGFADPLPVEGFESLDGFEVMGGYLAQPPSATIARSEARTHGGSHSAQLTFTRERGGQTLHGIRARDDGAPLAVVVSDTFLKQAKKKVGDELQIYVNRQYVTAKIAGRFAYFPTYKPQDGGRHLMLANLDRLLFTANRLAGGSDPGFANEVWMSGPPATPPTKEAMLARGIQVDQIVDLGTLRAAQQRDPLVAASWEGILFISFAAVLLLTALGFLVYSYLSAQARSLEFAILRTMGFSGRQIVALVSFEQAFVILAGTVAGTLLGLPLGRLMIGYMGVTETGARVLPPFVSQVSWQTVALADGLLAVTFVATIAALVLLYSRLALHRALRMGEL